MKFFAILLLASLASTSLSAPHEAEDKIYSVPHPTDAEAQVSPSSHPSMDVAAKDISKEATITTEEHFSQEKKVVVKSVRRPMSPKQQVPRPTPQEDISQDADLQSEQTAARTPAAEGILFKSGYEFGKKVETEVKKLLNYLKSLFPRVAEAISP
ncbi:PREDICTED: glycosylation-dependent cell adhesion molecule 1-like [Condylura cristata]|uniref:glycosylation-dependent cell adhesion molecule 1-like n=1 Tax=Condylura cristata TaxID=143302 RepID=UPI00064332F1|nr:PREDICTED: glycosylation-dependent cell adhesion molecule 1-like [Condylura cristata]